MITDLIRRLCILLALGLSVGLLAACGEQSSTEQVGEAVNEGASESDDAAGGDAADTGEAAN